jgi:hypothetical protein|tara:strand:- start:2871 stop:2999 length:129 start_codon:yes stop_codon:yes gene_type:complete
MIKKTILYLILCAVMISCGKKGDPEYKAIKKNKINTVLINKV